MVAPTRDSSLGPAERRRGGNPRAVASVVVGLAAVLVIPAALVLQYYSVTVTLIESLGSAGPALVFGLCLGISTGLAVGFYGLLTLFARS